MRNSDWRIPRLEGGFTLIEMMASALIISFVGAGICGLVMLNGMTEIRMSNKVDNLNATRTAIERVGRDVRMARNLGDVFGAPFLLQTTPTQVWGFGGSNTFPAPNNPLYPLYAPTSFTGWPQQPWPAGPSPGYTLSNQCLIVQVPIFDANGFPYALAQGFHGLPANEDDVDTLVYMVVPDPETADSEQPTYLLQISGFPGHNSTLAIRSDPPETILKGIVGPTANPGPVSANNPPVIFQYLDKTQGGVPQNTGTAQNGLTNGNLTGVLVQFQVLNQESGKRAPVVVGVKSEIYARNNNVQTVTATADDIGGP